MSKPVTIELAIIRRCQLGEADAFDSLYHAFGDLVWRLCRRMAGNAADAEDLAQEVWVTVWQQIKTFRCESSFGVWLYRVASNVCLQWLRKTRNKATCPMDEDKPDAVNLTADVVAKDTLDRVMGALHELPESLRLPLILRADEELSYAEIAEVLGCTTAAVKMRISRARILLADALEEMK